MPATFARYGVRGVRLALVVVGLGLAAVAGRALVAASSAGDGDGFVTAGAVLLWGSLVVLSLGVAGVGVALPAVLGATDSLGGGIGFDGRQRRFLRAAGLTVGGGVAVGVAGVGANSFVGILLSLGVILLGVLGVCSAVAWRLGGAVLRRLGGDERHTDDGGG